MTVNKLIAAVALEFIKSQLGNEDEGTLRFCMLGLEASLVISIAEAAIADPEINEILMVKISPQFDTDNRLSKSVRSDQSITHWRHCRLPEGKRAVLFSASHEELQRNDKSVEKITRLETDMLRALYPDWIECSGLAATLLDKSKLKHLEVAFQTVNETHTARTIETFSDFVLEVANGVDKLGLPLHKAIDHALPSLHLPRFSGYFDRIPESKREVRSEWAKIFRRLNTRIRPLLVQENERGDPISDQLHINFEEIRDRLEEAEQNCIQEFLDADLTQDEWSPSQINLVELDWRTISDLFEGLTKAPSVPLGEKTIQFFEDEFDDQLDEEDIELLSAPLQKEPSDELQEFFESHREHLARDKQLSTTWERYVYRNPQTYNDFLVGLLATIHTLRERTSDDELSSKKITVRIPKGREKSFWRGKNARVSRYFAFRYRGLDALLGENVDLDFGKLEEFYFPQADEDLSKTTSGARDARTLKFEVVFDPNGANSKLIFFWEMPVNSLATAMPDDLISVANLAGECALLPTADIARQSVSAKGAIQRIALENLNTIRDATNSNEGKLVAPNKTSGDRGGAFLEILEGISNVIGAEAHSNIGEKFRDFRVLYTRAIRDWVTSEGPGLKSKVFLKQAEAYGVLLRALIDGANNDVARQDLWKEILRVGVADVGAGAPAAITMPWHPLRLAEISIKANQTAKLINQVLESNEEDIYRADLLFEQIQLELQSNYYPEVCVGFDGERAILLAAANTNYDYTLYESPRRLGTAETDDSLDIDPVTAARAFGRVGEQYLSLLPHERSNFSVVLYNSESKALPSTLAAELARKVEKENELQCDLLLTHSDSKRMRRIYEQQNIAVSEQSGSVMASEASRNFLSRMRVGFLDATDLPDDGLARTADLVVLQDVISRNAKIVWKKAPGDRFPELAEHIPARWSRRRPIGIADTSTAVYIASPSQSLAGQTYLNSIQLYLEGDNAKLGDVIPAREVNFRDNDIGDVFRQTHSIGEWVVNIDELVDRRLLVNNDVQVIRHIHDRKLDHNIIVSTTSKPALLRALLRERLDRLDPNIIGNNSDDVIDKIIDRANSLSGQVVMRAARYGHYANELLGIVLSMQKIQANLGGSDFPIGWYFLDDFASWFGQREEQIADIMAIAPRIEDNKPILVVVISEAKFVNSASYKSHVKKSAKQLEETAARISRALDPEHKRIDRDIWLHRLGDFMIEGMEPFDQTNMNNWDLHKWSDEVRQGNVTIKLRGFSHVFVHDSESYVDAGEPTPLKGTPHCSQQIFDKSSVAEAFRHFATGRDLISDDDRHSPEDLASEITLSPENEPTNHEGPVSIDTTQSEASDTANVTQEPAAEPDEEASEQQPLNVLEGDSSHPVGEESDLSRWPSRELQAWVAKGKLSGEEDEESQKWLDKTVKSLQRAIRGYDMTAELVGARLTPNAALVRFRGSDDLTVPKVEKRRQELLTSHAINVINVLAAPMEVVIMVARPSRTILRLCDLWRQRELPETAPTSNTSLLLGACETDGNLLYLNVGDEFGGYHPHGPHTLIAGESGSGKGVLVQCLLLDICATNSPACARIRMIDPKAGIDFPWLRRMPHLDGDLITDQESAIHALEEMVAEMERRNRLLAEAGVSKLDNYNRNAAPADRLPRIWLFHDELADWMMIKEYRDAVELNANRLGVKARAAGINLILVTQRPDKDALPMQLRANLSNRLVLKVADKRNSILVLDEPGGERLLGQGHLAAKLSGEGKIILAQVPFASEEEIAEIARVIINAWS